MHKEDYGLMIIVVYLLLTPILLGLIWYYISLITTTSLQFRVVYYIPTGEAVGVVYLFDDKTDFYFYQQDLKYRIEGLAPRATERFLKSIQILTGKQLLSFIDFHNYFSDNFYISSIVPMTFFKSARYSIKRDILNAYKHHKFKKEKKARNEIDKRSSDRRLFGRCKALVRRCVSHIHIRRQVQS